ncbi:MAG: tyrosine-type recombinase/integrase [Reichenbachiella sp.]|uniref:tyrosine-type recombinase/integrase n=1 Tax=Reichenbachiella sp. TaxID=2184521 RepID=UPI00329A72C1
MKLIVNLFIQNYYGKKGLKTETSPMSWEQFQTLSSRIAYSIDHDALKEEKKKQLSKFLLLINIGCYCGLRLSDILNIEWGDVLERDTFTVTEQKTQKSRQLTINGSLKSLLKKYIDFIKPTTINDKVFTNSQGNVISRQYVNRRLKELFTSYKINVMNPSSHTLRKTFGLRVYEMNFKSDDALITLSHIFNHSSTAITRKYIGLQGKKIENIYLSL